MPNAYTRSLRTPTPQREPENSRQVANSAGGYTFTTDNRIQRFLILGTTGGSFYAGESKLTKENLKHVTEAITSAPDGGVRVVQMAREISIEGRAYSNSPALVTLALVLVHGSPEAKSAAVAALRLVARTSTHLFEFAEYVESVGGWGRTKRTAVANWYTSQTPDRLAYQVIKYRQRNGWTHRDLFRLAHPKGIDRHIGEFVLKGTITEDGPEYLKSFRLAQESVNLTDILLTIEGAAVHGGLVWEAIPTKFLKEPEVWKKLFYNGQLRGQALIRNITRLARIGAFDDMVFTHDYAKMLTDKLMIQATRLHPINYLNAYVVHQTGQVPHRTKSAYGYSGARQKDWNTNPVILSALDEGFYSSFKYIQSANKRTFIGLDVSGSMSGMAMGLDLSCAQVGAAFSLAVAKSEPFYQIYGFSDGTRRGGWGRVGNTTHLTDLGIAPSMDLSTVMSKTSGLTFGRTDCALPMKFALEHKIAVDTFIIVTDNETWFGDIHPHVALQKYRQAMGINARLVVVAVASNGFTIADPTDDGSIDVVGFDSATPKVIADFSAGRI
jgi:60 kDa SS-A/Ro ribonucleoprotein